MKYFKVNMETGYCGGDESVLVLTNDDGMTMGILGEIDGMTYDHVTNCGHEACENCGEDLEDCECGIDQEENVGSWGSETLTCTEFYKLEAVGYEVKNLSHSVN